MKSLFAWTPLGVLAACVPLAPVVFRALALHEKDLRLAAGDLRGFLADLVVSAAVLVVCLALLRWSRVAAFGVAALWVLLGVVNFEHVRALDAAASFAYAGYLVDPVFLEGSGLRVSHPLAVAGTFLLLGAAAFRWPLLARPRRRSLWAGAGALVAGVAALAAWPIRRGDVPWRQDNVVVVNAREALWSLIAQRAPVVHDAATLKQLFQPDLSGAPRVPVGNRRPNVLLVMVEGLSGAYLPSLSRHQRVPSSARMPGLDALSARGLTYLNAFAHQRQTNRGEYSVLCGDYPKLLSEEARMNEYARAGTRACLPEVLGEAGYQTAYVQSAPLGFMMKDQFMARAGFDRVLGSEYFPEAYARSRWGVDDKAFFEQSTKLVRELQATDAPWFLAMLTVGTHHPYLVAPGFEGRGTPFSRAVQYADEAVVEFLARLEQEGVLEDTVVILTADESNGVTHGDDVTRTLSQSWIPLVVLLPGGAGAGQRVSEPVAYSDLALSIADYLGLPPGAAFVGRSIFRSYERPRPIYFSNTQLRKVWALEPGGLLSACTERLDDCVSYLVDPQRPFDPARGATRWRPELLVAWRTAVDHTLRPLDAGPAASARTLPLTSRPELQLHPTGQEELVFGGQYLPAARGERMQVELEVEVVGPDGAGVALTQDTYSPAGRLHRPTIPLLRAGDRLRLGYAYVLDKDLPNLEVVLSARTVGEHAVSLRFPRAQVSFGPAPKGTRPGLVPNILKVDRKPLEAPVHYSLDVQGHFYRDRCLRQIGAQVEGKDCKNAFLLFGPYTWAPKGARVVARFEVEVTRGEAILRGEVVSGGGGRRLASSEAVKLAKGGRTVLESSFSAGAEVDEVEARLQSRVVGDSADVVIRSATLDITL